MGLSDIPKHGSMREDNSNEDKSPNLEGQRDEEYLVGGLSSPEGLVQDDVIAYKQTLNDSSGRNSKLSIDSELLKTTKIVEEPSRVFQAHGWDEFKNKEEERIRKTKRARTIEDMNKYSYVKLILPKVSILPRIIWPTLGYVIWTTIWTVVYEVFKLETISIPPTVISVLGVAVTLLLVFRTNTSYDRYWEGRCIWSSIISCTRNMARIIWTGVRAKTKSDLERRHGCINLLIAYAVATKHNLRNELGHNYEDLHYLLAHVPEFSPNFETVRTKHLPEHIVVLISRYLKYCYDHNQISSNHYDEMIVSITKMFQCLTSLERIRNTPIPFSYSVHISQSLSLYLLTLPFQIVKELSWWTITVVLIATFILLGLDIIGADIENPFGYEKNKLHLDRYCDELKEDIYSVIFGAMPNVKDWGPPYIEPAS